MIRYILDRLAEASTWRGVVLILTAVGVSLTTEQTEAIVAAGLAIAGSIGAFLPD
jgi:hypothetical protein